ncbi:DUF86 domain-containing protein [Patescibacteria group bacterium]|nr:DUF86 domain-containing protein [Patescibacteria group bacterium]
MKREIGDYIQDIVDAMNKSAGFIENMSYDDFIEDEKTIFAMIRALEVVGEAVKNIPKKFREKYPEIPWRDMAGMRDKLIHEYFGVNSVLLWKTAKEKMPLLKPLFEKMLEDFQNFEQKLIK